MYGISMPTQNYEDTKICTENWRFLQNNNLTNNDLENPLSKTANANYILGALRK
ncbi:hypothetical protein HMPREF1586_00061 [Gardnerella vaginalis JCP8522]|nr:hypothetical protein HMPREF1586_00061 [Gardnerella vaginalis JCP8522]